MHGHYIKIQIKFLLDFVSICCLVLWAVKIYFGINCNYVLWLQQVFVIINMIQTAMLL